MQAIYKAKSIPREEALKPKIKGDHEDSTFFTLTYHPHNMEVRKILLKHFPILQSSPEIGTTFKHPPLTAFKRDRNLGDLLVKSSFAPPVRPPTPLWGIVAAKEKSSNAAHFSTLQHKPSKYHQDVTSP